MAKNSPKFSRKHCNHRYERFFSCADFKLEKCSYCQLIRTVGTDSLVNVDYHHTDIEEAVKQFWMHGQEYKRFAKKLFDGINIKPGRLLDVGCGLGWFTAEANRRGFKATGVDPSKGMITYGQKKVEKNLVNNFFENFNRQKKIDYILVNHVLEHIADLSSFLRHARQLLKPGGKIIVATPNIDSLMFWTFRCHWYPMSPRQHLWQFTPQTLIKILRDEGFITKKVIINSMDYSPPNPFKKFAFMVLTSFANLIGHGDQVIAIAQKYG